MRIVSLDPALTELVRNLGAGAELAGVSSRCELDPKEVVPPLVLTGAQKSSATTGGAEALLRSELSFEPVDLEALRRASPDVVLARVSHGVLMPNEPAGTARAGAVSVQELEARLRAWLGNDKVQLVALRPSRLEGIYALLEAVGAAIGRVSAAHERAQRLKAQLMDWADNFYDRTKNKKVTFLSSIAPMRLGGLWIPDMVALCSAISQERTPGAAHRETSWNEVVAFNPDVIVVAPEGVDLKGSMATFKELSKLPGWDDLPAVKRSEVFFTDGIKHFYNPAVGIVDSMAILISAIAGFESGYIATRDTFYRLRWLELHRHRL